ncbi:unnamed protein product [Closterium sp. NIES-53]
MDNISVIRTYTDFAFNLTCLPKDVSPNQVESATAAAAATPLAAAPQQQQGQQQGSGPRQLSRGTPHAVYDVVDSSASDSVYSRVFNLGAKFNLVPVASVGTCLGTSPGAAPEDASLSFTLDSGASHCFFRDHTTLTLLLVPVSVALADPTSGPIVDPYATTLPCPAVPSSFLTSFHVPSFSRNLVGVRPLVDSHVGVRIEPSGDIVTYVDGDTYAPLATFHAEPGSGLYTLNTSPRDRQQQQQQQQLPATPDIAPR